MNQHIKFNTQSICIIGLGGVGGFFAAHFSEQKHTSGIKLYGTARGGHWQAIREKGLHVERNGIKHICQFDGIFADTHPIPEADLYIIAVKEYDLASVLLKLKPLIKESTILLPLLNGIDIYGRIRANISRGIVIPACVYVGTKIAQPGIVIQKGGEGIIHWGHDPEHSSHGLSSLKQSLCNARIKNEYSPQIDIKIWEKYLFICAFGLCCSAYGKNLAWSVANKQNLLRLLLAEIVSLAEKENIKLPAGSIDSAIKKASEFPETAKPSLLRDLEKGNAQHELSLYTGSMQKLAQKHKTKIPAMELATKMICNRFKCQQ